MLEDEELVSIDNFLPFAIVIIVSIFMLYFISRFYADSEKSMEEYASELYNQIMEIRGKLWLWMNMEGGAIKIVK